MDKNKYNDLMGLSLIVIFFVGLLFAGTTSFEEIETFEPVEDVEELISPMEERRIQLEQIKHLYEDQIACLAMNMYFEARGEDQIGQDAVAYVTLNRVMSDRYPDTVCEVVYQARTNSRGFPLRNQCQFSWYCDGRPDVVVEPVYDRLYNRAEQIYMEYYLMNGNIDDVTMGSTHYHAVYVEPYWSKHENYQLVASIGDHVFYKPTY